MREKMREKVKKAKKAVKNVNVIVSDMRQHRSEYDAKDLGWRCVDVALVLIEVMGILVKAMDEMVDKIIEISPERKVVQLKDESAEILEEEKLKKEVLNGKEKVKSEKEKETIIPSRPKVVGKSKGKK